MPGLGIRVKAQAQSHCHAVIENPPALVCAGDLNLCPESNMAQEQSRLQKLGRQAMPVRHEHDMAPCCFTLVNSADVLRPKLQQSTAYFQGWLALKVPPKLPKLAECNAPVGAVRSLVQVCEDAARCSLFYFVNKYFDLLSAQGDLICLQCHIVDNSIEVDAAQKAMQEYKQVSFRCLRCMFELLVLHSQSMPLQAEEKRQAKMLKLLGSRDALRHRIHNHLQQQAAAFQETDSKVGLHITQAIHYTT